MIKVYWYEILCKGIFVVSSDEIYFKRRDCALAMKNDVSFYGGEHYGKIISCELEKEELSNFMECVEMGISY